MTTARRVGVAATAAVTLLLAGCAGGGDAAPSGSSRTTTDVVTTGSAVPSPVVSPTPSPTKPRAVEPAPSASATAPVEGAAPSAGTGDLAAAVVKEIRTADHGTFDRVVVEYTGSFGAWSVRYVDKVMDDPQGIDVPLKGSAFLDVRVQKATFDNLFQVGGGVEHTVYGGPRRFSPGLTNVQEIADAGDFEAVMGLGIGLTTKGGVRAYRLNNPSRLVIDVAH